MSPARSSVDAICKHCSAESVLWPPFCPDGWKTGRAVDVTSCDLHAGTEDLAVFHVMLLDVRKPPSSSKFFPRKKGLFGIEQRKQRAL
jgi:hypothetical protein